jgi:RHS repeat-associated protein
LSKIGTGVNDEQLRVKYVYDGRSNLKEIIRLKRDTNHDPVEKAHEFHYDILNRPFEALDPMSGLAVTHYDPYCKNFTTTSPRGVKTRVMRDSLCRVTQVATNDEKREFFYDELSRLVTVVQTHNPPAVYDDPENLPEDRPPARYGFSRYGDVSTSETIHYLYDELNRLVKITYPDNGNKTVLYEYDGDGRVTKVTDILEHVTEYSYYNDGRLYQVTAKNGGGDQVFTYSYDLAGRPYEIQYPSASGVVAKFYDASNNSGWDANGRLTCLRYMKKDTPPLPDIPILSFEYTYDPSGNRTQWVETPASGPSITWDYEYDWLDRLVSVSKDTIQQSVYVYDESDNRIELQLPVLGDTHTYRYDFADRILERLVDSTPTETFEHDADGNMIARTFGGATTYYKWDNSDKLTSIKRVSFEESYQYDTEGLRKSKGEDARYVSSGALSLADQLPSNSISYIQGHQLLGMLQGGNYYWYISDGLGTVRLVVSSNGTTSSTYAGDEFGRQTAVSGSAGLRQHTYVGALGVRNEVATNSELLLMGQRYYDPTLGRFLNQDPIGFVGGLNMFTYVGNSPVDRVDPSGLDWYITDNDKVHHFTPDQGHDALRYLIQHQDTITQIETSGHACFDLAGADPVKGRYRSGLEWLTRHGSNAVVFYIEDPKGERVVKGVRYHDFDISKLHFKTLRKINLWGCDTASFRKGEPNPHNYPVESDVNIAHRIAEIYPGTDVEGHVGTFWGGTKWIWGRIYRTGRGGGVYNDPKSTNLPKRLQH